MLFYWTKKYWTKFYTIFFIKILNKQELQQIALNHSSDIDFQIFMCLYKMCNAKPNSFYVNDTTPALDNYLRFRKNLLEKKYKNNHAMTIHDKIYNEKLQYDINQEAAKTPALLLGKIDQYK